MEPEIGQVIDGKYRLVRLLGAGGMGAVYEGENTRIRRRVAIKMLHAQVSTQQESVTRFEREAQAAGRIGSEHICEVLDLGVLPDGTRYMVMEYLEGETLSGRIKQLGRLTPAQAIPLITQVLEGLDAAHAAGIIHRDLKPDNVWIVPTRGGSRDFVKVLDFGVSKFSQIGGEEMNTTRAGAVVGTPYYMSPEQARGMSAIDARTDIYAMGVVLYQAATGQVPYQAETFNELLFKIVLEVAPPPQTYVPDMDADFVAIIQKAMAREPAQRYQTCAEFREALLAFQSSHGQRPGPQPQQHPQGGGGHVPQTWQSPQGAPGQPTQAFPGSPQAQAFQGSRPSFPGNAPDPRAVSGVNPGVPAFGSSGVSAVGPNGPMATSQAWGNASLGGAAPPKSKGGIVIGVIAAVVLLGAGGGAAVALKMGGGSSAAAPGEASATAVAASAAPSAKPAEPPPATAQPSASASTAPQATAEPTAAAPAASSAPAAEEPAATEAPHAAQPTKGGRLPAPTRGPKPKPGNAQPAPAAPPPPRPAGGVGDLGY